MPVTAKSLIEAANAEVPKISGKDALELVANGALLVDVRDGTEVAATGRAAGAIQIPRGSLEFKADPAGHARATYRLQKEATYVSSAAGL